MSAAPNSPAMFHFLPGERRVVNALSLAVRKLLSRDDVTPRQIVLAWLLARSPSILPIPGTGSVAHLEDNVTAAAIKLATADVASLTSNAG